MKSNPPDILLLGSEGSLGSELVQLWLGRDLGVFGIDKHPVSQHDIGYYQVDCAFPAKVQEAIQVVTLQYPSIKAVVSTLGVFGQNDLEVYDLSAFQHSVQVNLMAVCAFFIGLAQFYVKQMKPLRLVAVGSAAGNAGSQDFGYAVSKAGLNGLIVSLSKAYASKGITVMGVNPGIFDSSMSRAVPIERQEKTIEKTHLKRIGTLSEVSSVVSYVALEAPDYLSGAIIPVNGGQYT